MMTRAIHRASFEGSIHRPDGAQHVDKALLTASPGTPPDPGAGITGERMSSLCWVVWGQVCPRPWLHDLDGPRTSARRQPKPPIHHAQEVPGEGPARGVRRWEGLGQEEARPVRRDMGECMEHPLEQERRLFECDILNKEVGQRIHEDREPDRMGGEQRRQAFTQEGGELPAGKRPREAEAPEEEVRGNAAGFGHGDDRRHVNGHGGIHHCHLQPLGHGARGGPERHPMDAPIPPEEERAGLRGDRRPCAYGQEVRPGRWQRLGSRVVIHGTAIISTHR